jgi:hypothetical protein
VTRRDRRVETGILMQQNRLNQVETADNAEDNPALSNVIERNIRAISG